MTAQSSARELVTVAGRAIEKLEYEGNPVITLKMIDELHGRPAGTARRNFNANRKQFQSREDFVVITTLDEFRTTGARHNPNGLTLFTESGYLKLVKTFTDDLAWQVQGQLVECYFRVKHEIQQTPSIPSDPVLAMLAVMQDLRKAQISLSEQNQVLAVGLAETRHDLAKFVEERRLENWQQANILKAVNHKVELWREAYPQLNVKKAYPAIWRHVKEKFSVPRYNEIPAAKYDDAMALIRKLHISNLAGL